MASNKFLFSAAAAENARPNTWAWIADYVGSWCSERNEPASLEELTGILRC